MEIRSFTLNVSMVSALLLLFFMNLSAQNNDMDGFREKVENIKLEKMIKKLELDETSASSFKSKYKEFSRTLRELNLIRLKTYKSMVENLDNADGLDTLVDRLLKVDNEINTKRNDFASELRTMLTTKQFATMIVFERKFNNEIRKLLKEYRKENKGERKDKNE